MAIGRESMDENGIQGGEAILPRLHERDIDVILQEEILFNEATRNLVCKSLGLPQTAMVRSCELWIADASGETDILATFLANGKAIAVLIENKIDAAFQPGQPERYRKRAERLISEEARFAQVFCALVAPAGYAKADADASGVFNAIISYEDIAQTIAHDATPRAQHRAALILQAISQAHSPYVLAPIAEISELWQRIYRLANAEFPVLQMRPPAEKGAGGYWVSFKVDLPPCIVIDWKIRQGVVDLSFWKNALHRPLPDIDLSGLGRQGSVVQLNETLAIRVPVAMPPPDWTELSDAAIREALDASVALHRFFRSHPEQFA